MRHQFEMPVLLKMITAAKSLLCHSEGALEQFAVEQSPKDNLSRNISKVRAKFVILREQLEHFASEQSLKDNFPGNISKSERPKNLRYDHSEGATCK
jgi:hypothetical protein